MFSTGAPAPDTHRNEAPERASVQSLLAVLKFALGVTTGALFSSPK